MAEEKDQLPPIEPLHEQWEPNPIPANIEVPGLDTSAPVQDQIEQIEQLITIKLQNIDANFARTHQILSTRILPAVKRYAVNTEPVRDAARFWVSFYEQAAQVRIPTTEDFSAETQRQATASDEEMEVEQPQEKKPQPRLFDPNTTPSESSFRPENAAVSSTPMPHPSERPREESAEVRVPEMRSNPDHSPLKRLNDGLKSLGEQGQSVVADSRQNIFSATQQSIHSETSSSRPFLFPMPDKGKAQFPPLFSRAVLGKEKEQKRKSPIKIKKTPKKNPYVPPDIRRADWDGIVDLTKPVTPRRGTSSNADWTSDEEEFPPPGVSPPRSAFGKRIAAQIGRTPGREAAARIGRDLIGDAERFQFKRRLEAATADSTLTSSMAASSPSVSRFTKQAMGIESRDQSSTMSRAEEDSSRHSKLDVHPNLRSMMERFNWEREHGFVSDGVASGSGFAIDRPIRSVFPHLLPDQDFGNPDEYEDSFEQMDVEDDPQVCGNWSRGGRPLSFRPAQADETYDESVEYEDDRGGDGNEEPTVFGSRHAQLFGGQLQLHGGGIVDDTTALNSRMRRNVDPETPTPWVGGAQGDGL